MVNKLIQLLSARQATILSGAAVLMVTVAASKILGLVRDRLLAHTFSPEQTAMFLAAFRLPDLLFQLLIFGAVSVAFIPVFTDYLHKKGEKEAFEFASDILNVVILGFSLLCLLVFIFARPITGLIVPGFTPEQKLLTSSLTQIILLGQIALAVGSFFAGILQSYQRFILPSLAAVLYNLGIILGILFLSPALGIYGPTLGVVLGAILHVLVQISLIGKLGFHHRLRLNFFSSGIKEVLSLMGMRTIGVAIEQLNETVGVILASIVSTSSVTYLTFAQHLQTVPIGLFGATIAQATLPVLSQENARGDVSSFKTTLLTTLHQILFLTLPSTAILVVLRVPVVRLVFGASQFNWEATVLTGKTVAFLALGLAAQSMALLLMRGFYALKDTKTPVLVSIISVGLNIVLSVVFVNIFKFEVWGLGLSYAISSNISIILLIGLLGRKVGSFDEKSLFLPALKMLVAATLAMIALYIPIKALDKLVFDTTKTINLLLLTIVASGFGLGVYVGLVWWMKVRELETFTNLAKKVFTRKFKIESEEIVTQPDTV